MEASRPHSHAALSDAVFDRLVGEHRARLERYTRGLGASREDAEEIASTALLRAYQNPPAARRDDEWRAWLSTVARNLWIDTRRRRQLRLVTGEDSLVAVPSPTPPVDQIAAAAQEARQICAAIALLPPTERAAIYLREVRGLSYEEIGAELGITQSAVTTTLQRARNSVKQRRGSMAHVLSALSFLPLGWLRRGASAANHVTLSGAIAKIGVPVLLAASAGGAGVLATQHPFLHRSSDSPARLAAETRSSSPAIRGPHTTAHNEAAQRTSTATASTNRRKPLVARRSAPQAPTAPAAATPTASTSIPHTGPPVTRAASDAPHPRSGGHSVPKRGTHASASASRRITAHAHASARSSKAAGHAPGRPATAPTARTAHAPTKGAVAASSAHAPPHPASDAPAAPPKASRPAGAGGTPAHTTGGTGTPATESNAHASSGAPADTGPESTAKKSEPGAPAASGVPAAPAQSSEANPGLGHGAP